MTIQEATKQTAAAVAAIFGQAERVEGGTLLGFRAEVRQTQKGVEVTACASVRTEDGGLTQHVYTAPVEFPAHETNKESQ